MSQETIPRLNQCYLCKTWRLERKLSLVEVPDQSGYVQKPCCKACLDEVKGDDDAEQLD
jgi:hypothetical protein